MHLNNVETDMKMRLIEDEPGCDAELTHKKKQLNEAAVNWCL